MSEVKKVTRKPRTPKIHLTADGNENTKLVAENAYLLVSQGYRRLMQVCHGKRVRGSKDKGDYQEFPLEKMSDARRKYYEDKFALLHEMAFSSLEHGRKVETVTEAVPD